MTIRLTSAGCDGVQPYTPASRISGHTYRKVRKLLESFRSEKTKKLTAKKFLKNLLSEPNLFSGRTGSDLVGLERTFNFVT